MTSSEPSLRSTPPHGPWLIVAPRPLPTSTDAAGLPLGSAISRTMGRIEMLSKALASVGYQTYPNIEVVVVNDGGCEIFRGRRSIRRVVHAAALVSVCPDFLFFAFISR